jgi:hypothetical protein
MQAVARGDGALWAPSPRTEVMLDETGDVSHVSVHWCDVNVEIRTSLPIKRFASGCAYILDWRDQPVVRVGPAAGGLPPVTVKAQTVIQAPVGHLGARVT